MRKKSSKISKEELKDFKEEFDRIIDEYRRNFEELKKERSNILSDFEKAVSKKKLEKVRGKLGQWK
jgi:soluble cytochrome b562